MLWAGAGRWGFKGRLVVRHSGRGWRCIEVFICPWRAIKGGSGSTSCLLSRYAVVKRFRSRENTTDNWAGNVTNCSSLKKKKIYSFPKQYTLSHVHVTD